MISVYTLIYLKRLLNIFLSVFKHLTGVLGWQLVDEWR